MSDVGLIRHLSDLVTPERIAKMRRVLEERTRYLSVVIEDIYQPHNASAVLRTCDCFGIQDVHIVENRNTYRVNPGVELGTAQWLTLHRYNSETSNTPAAIDHLRSAGYRIVATTPHTGDRSLDDFDLEAGPTALLFGNELEGLSETALNLADEQLVVPMVGFVESFNISVSAAIILHSLSSRLRASRIAYHISPEESDEILLHWLRRSIGRVEALEWEFHARARHGSGAET